jgi:UDPglucose 6-dehydrogenase
MTVSIAVVGVGRIGAVTAIGLAHLDHDVTGVDRSEERLAQLATGVLPESEPGLRAALRSALRYRQVRFAASLEPESQDILVLCVDTPPHASGMPDLSQVMAAMESHLPALRRDGIVITRSTVPVGTGDRLVALARHLRRFDIEVVHVPEFLREGTAWEDFREPDRIVVGGIGTQAIERVAALFSPLEERIVRCDRRTAEFAKYAANAFLATSISFANEMDDLCQELGVGSGAVFDILRRDQRIGPRAYLAPGLGFGGHCLPKDTAALEHLAGMHGLHTPLLSAVRAINGRRTGHAVAWLRRRLGELDGARICIAGLAFKRGTDDVRESPALALAQALAAEGVRVAGWDPIVGEIPSYIERFESLDDAVAGADALVLTGASSQWLLLNPAGIASRMRRRVVYDVAGALDADAWATAGFAISTRPAPIVEGANV